MRSRAIAWACLCWTAFAAISFAQDPVKADPRHFKLEFEDEQVRVLRFTLPPGEFSPMHEHMERVTVVVRGGRIRVTDAAGMITEAIVLAGDVRRRPYAAQSVTNIGDTVYEAVSTEFKQPGFEYAAAGAAPKVPPTREVIKTQQAETQAGGKPVELPQPVDEVPPTAVPEMVLPKTSIAGGKTVSINGAEINYFDAGSGATVVFVHGSPGDYRSMGALFTALSSRYHVVTYSRRYHYPNYSTGKENDYNYEQHVRDLAEFLHKLGVGPVHLVGDAYGATVAGMLAAREPAIVRTVTLMDPGYDGFLDPIRAEAAKYARDEIYNIARKALRRERPEQALNVYMDWSLGSGTWYGLGPDLQLHMKQNAKALQDQVELNEAPKFGCAEARGIKAPLLLLTAERSAPNYLSIIGGIASCTTGSQKLIVPNSGHGMVRDNPNGIAQALRAFLEQH